MLVLATAACDGGKAPVAVPAVPSTAPVAHPVATLVETFVDTSRPTPAHGPFPEKPARTLRTNVLFPSDGGGPYPLIVFAHGSGAFGTEYLPMLRAWATAGYVVAVPEFPVAADGPDGEVGDSSSILDLANQPGDLSFAVDQLLRVAADPAGPLKGIIDPERIGAAGHSLGAMATLALAANTCCHDPRVKAAVMLAGREVPFGSGTFFTRIRTPVLFVHGDADTNVAYRDGRTAYADAPPPRFFLTLAGAHHSDMYDPIDAPAASASTRVTIDFFDAYVKGVGGAVERLRADGGGALESET